MKYKYSESLYYIIMTELKKIKERKSILIEKSIHQRLKVKAAEIDKSITEIVEHLITIWLDRNDED